MPITSEQFEELPDFVKSDYVKSGEGYDHKDAGKVDSLKSSLDALDAKFKNSEKARNEELEAIREEEREKALADAKKANNIDEILRIEREQAEDARIRAIEEAKGEWQREMSEKEAAQRAKNLAKEIAFSVAVDEDAAELIEQSILSRIKSDVDLQKDVFSDRSGSALSVDKDGFIEAIKKERQFSRLVKSDVSTSGTGGANGNSGGSASKKPNEYTEQERVDLFRTNPTLFNELFPKRT